ncbi:hypothetical protein FHX06_006580 [Rhizobium sp. BK512]|nr:hypothetical protein [Rhizobium sp. BK512]MBB3565210.1 hypothetical protein [Rhizobium sp. BK512]
MGRLGESPSRQVGAAQPTGCIDAPAPFGIAEGTAPLKTMCG